MLLRKGSSKILVGMFDQVYSSSLLCFLYCYYGVKEKRTSIALPLSVKTHIHLENYVT